MGKILKENSKFVYKSYLNKEMLNLMTEQIKYFSRVVKKNSGKPMVIIFPYREDLHLISSRNKILFSNYK